MENIRANSVQPKPMLPFEGERRRNDIGIVECYLNVSAAIRRNGKVRPMLLVYQEGTNHEPFLMPVTEFERLPKVDI